MKIQKALKVSLIILAGLIIGLSIQALKTLSEPIPENERSNAVFAPGFNPGFSLINHEGEQVTEQDYNDKYQLVYFGFTFCPEICPTELQKMVRALNEIPEHQDDIYPMFISVDPVRDTPEVMKQYLSNFSDDFVGLTGTEAQVDDAMAAFKVYAAKADDPAYAEYMMDHSSYIYFLNQKGDLLGLYGKNSTHEDIAKDLKIQFGK